MKSLIPDFFLPLIEFIKLRALLVVESNLLKTGYEETFTPSHLWKFTSLFN